MPPLKEILLAAHEFVWIVLAAIGSYLALMAGWAMMHHG